MFVVDSFLNMGQQIVHNFAQILDESQPPPQPTQDDNHLFEASIDERFEFDEQTQSWKFTAVHNATQGNNNHIMQQSTQSVIRVTDLIECLQELNEEFQILTDFVDKSSTTVSGYNVGTSNVQKQRIRQLKFQIEMLQKKSKQYTSSEKLSMENAQKNDSIFHLVRDFDQIRFLYSEAQQESQFLLEELRLQHHLMTIEDQNKEQAFLTQLVKHYVEAPAKRDEIVRHLNQHISREYDDDPAMLVFDGSMDDETKPVEQLSKKYPRIVQTSMNSRTGREERRNRLVNGAKGSQEEADRISAILDFLHVKRPI